MFIVIKGTWYLSGLAGPTSQLLNGTPEFSELVLTRMVLPIDQSRSVLPLWSAKIREFGVLWREKCTRMPWSFQFNWPEPVLSVRQTGQVESDRGYSVLS